MQVLILDAPRQLRLVDFPLPQLGARDLLIQVKACGICGSDVHGYDGTTGRRIPPLIMGHEAAGEVVRVGPEVRSFRVGDRVTFDSTISCGQCQFCLRGEVNLCDSRQVLGVSCGDYRRHGAFAEFVAVPEHIVYALPASFPYAKAALIEAVSIGMHAVKISGVSLGSTAVVIGAGMIGLLTIQVLRHFGCSTIHAVDVDEARLRLARQLGADHTLLGAGTGIVSRLKDLTNGQGPDLAIEAVGSQSSVTTAIESVRRGGTVTLIGNLAPKVEIPLQTVVTRQLRLLGSCASAGEYQECIDLMESGAVKVDELISAVAPLGDGAAWFERLYRREPGLMKVILVP
jgi:L-iditol 2-dehydrogenase